MTLLDQFRHEPVEERKQQSRDMCSVHVGIRHDDDPVVSKFFDIKIFMDTSPECGDHRADLRIP